MDAATLEFQKTAPQKGGPGSSKSKKRGRGRPSFSPNSSGPVSTQNGVVASQSGDANTTSKADETNFGQHSSEQDDSQIPVNIDHDLSREHDNEAMDVAENNEGDQDQKADDGGEMDVDAGQDETETKEQEDNAPQQLIIKATHPLMGVWQGSFAVKTLKGKHHSILWSL